MIGGDGDEDETPVVEEDNAGTAFRNSPLSPVKYWGDSPKAPEKSQGSGNTLRPGIRLEFGGTLSSSEEDDQSLLIRSKAEKSPEARKFSVR